MVARVTTAVIIFIIAVSVHAFPQKDVLFAEVPIPEVKDLNDENLTDIQIADAQVEQADVVVKTIFSGNAPVIGADENDVEGKVSYSGAQLWKVVIDSIDKQIVVAALRDRKEISPWGGNTKTLDILVHPKYIQNVAQTLDQAGIRREIMILDIQRAIDTENPEPSEDEEELANRNGHRMTWSAYHRLSDINDYLDYLAVTYPSLCSVRTIGSSVQGRPIKLLKISNGNAGNKAVWIDGGIHAREWISPATVTYIINQFVENYETESEDVKNIDWYIVPVVNPDGYEYSHTKDRLWRKNRAAQNQCAGTDLNRNFGYKWGGKGSSKNPCTEIYGGRSAFSEPETAAIRNFITTSGANFKAYLSFHSYGQYILYPWGYDRFVPPDYKDLQTVAQKAAQIQLQETKDIIKSNESLINKQSYALQQELDDTIEQLKDTREQNTVLQLQLSNLTKTHQELKTNYEELLTTKRNLEIKLNEIDSNFTKCKSELISCKDNNEKLSESETNLKKLLEIEKIQSKTARLQNEKDTKCIQDLNRQVKEMERIIQRKHPDSVSALIVAANKDTDNNGATRTLLENRIKQLEQEANLREKQSNNVFSEIQEKFNQMKDKYERHIEDLEVHVNDLKNQLRSKADTYDIYTQTYTEETLKVKETPIKELFEIGIQTDLKPDSGRHSKNLVKKSDKIIDNKEDAHLIATIRGLQADLTAKDKLYGKLQKELEELRKTNRKLQKDRETSLRIASEKREKHLDRNISHSKSPDPIIPNEPVDTDVKLLRDERDKLKDQLCRLEDDYQTLKTKRLQDLNILQEAHERELTTYMSNIGPMREQLDVQQISIKNLQAQLANAKEELAILTVERDHLDSRVKNLSMMDGDRSQDDETTQLSLQKKIAYLERRYEEREHRLRAIVHGLAQKHVIGRDCAQCAARQQQLIGYKAELDQLLATLRYLQ